MEGKIATQFKKAEHFVEILKLVEISPEDYLLSFDVESLFTNILLEEDLNIMRKKLAEDETLMDQTDLSVDAIKKLLEACLKNC